MPEILNFGRNLVKNKRANKKLLPSRCVREADWLCVLCLQMATEVVPSSMATTNDTGYLGFKMAKLGEMTLGIRKELDEMQLWRDRVSDCEVGHACSVSQSLLLNQ